MTCIPSSPVSKKWALEEMSTASCCCQNDCQLSTSNTRTTWRSIQVHTRHPYMQSLFQVYEHVCRGCAHPSGRNVALQLGSQMLSIGAAPGVCALAGPNEVNQTCSGLLGPGPSLAVACQEFNGCDAKAVDVSLLRVTLLCLEYRRNMISKLIWPAMPQRGDAMHLTGFCRIRQWTWRWQFNVRF